MNISLINPPSPFLINQKVYPPLGVLYLAAMLREKGFNVRVTDLGAFHNWKEELSKLRAAIFGITANTAQFKHVQTILKKLKENNPNSIFIAGGVHPTAFPKKCLALGFDSVIVGEGEGAIGYAVKKIEQNKQLEKIIQFSYIKNIDTIPFPARDLIPIKEYRFEIARKNSTTMMTSRGCPYNCAFCTKGTWGRITRFRSAANVIAEAKELREKFGYERIMFFDDIFTLRRERLYKICQGLRELGILWRCFIRADAIDKEMLEKMYGCGCVEVGIGVESGSQKILDNVHKGTTVAMNSNAVKLCKEIGVKVKAFLLVGLPGETPETLRETKQWLIENRPDKYDLSIYMPYAQSEIWNNCNGLDIRFDKDKIRGAWYKGKEGRYHSYVSTKELSAEEILHFRNETVKELGKRY